MKCKALRCIYYNEGNGYTVASYVTEEALPEKVSTQKNSQYGMFTAVGNKLPTEDGLEVELNGTWKDGKFGMYKDDSFHSTKFSTDHGYATSLDMYIYLWKEDIEEGESVMTAEYRPIEYGKDYDVVNNPDKFQLYIDGEEIE